MKKDTLCEKQELYSRKGKEIFQQLKRALYSEKWNRYPEKVLNSESALFTLLKGL